MDKLECQTKLNAFKNHRTYQILKNIGFSNLEATPIGLKNTLLGLPRKCPKDHKFFV